MGIFCVVCGERNPTTRMTTCSDACRSKLSRERKKNVKLVEKNQLNLFEQSQVNQLEKAVPQAGLLVRRIFEMYGKEPAIWAMEAIELTCNFVAENQHNG